MRGKRYSARRYELIGKRRVRSSPKFFETLDEALIWQTSGKNVTSSDELDEGCQGLRLEKSSGTKKPSNSYTFRQLVEDFRLKRFPRLSAGTRVFYENKIKHFEMLMDYEVEKLSPKVIDDWILWLTSDQKTKSYQSTRKDFSREVICLKAILNWYLKAFDHAQLVMPFKERHFEELEKKDSSKHSPSFMSVEESQLWLETLKKVFPEIHPVAVIQTEQIMRASEVFGMTWSELDLQRKTYKLCRHVEWLRVRGSKPTLQKGTKVLKPGEYVILPLRQITVDQLTTLSKKKDNELIFHRKGKLWSYREIQYRYDKAFQLAGLPYRGTHICRHTGATHFLNETGDELALTAMGGWKTTQQARHYGQVLGLTVRKAVDRADQVRSIKTHN